jgi:hypothetical protein
MPERRQGPLRAAMRRAALLSQLGGVAEALAGVVAARGNAPLDGRGLAPEEAAALAAGWEFQAVVDLYWGRLEAGIEDLAMAEQVLDGRPEYNELRGRMCVQIASQLSDTPVLRPVKAEYVASARELLAGSQNYQELLGALENDFSGD